MKFLQRYGIWLHLTGWLVFISLPLLTLPDFLWNRKDLISLGMAQLLTSLLTMVFFYYSLDRLTPDLLSGGSSRRFWLVMTAMLAGVVAVKVVSFYVFPPAFERSPVPSSRMAQPSAAQSNAPNFSVQKRPRGPGPGPRSPWPGVPGTMVSFSFAMLVASLLALLRHQTRSEEARQQMVLEKVSAELAMLKLQVSPHFLFNTLNNIRWLARKKSEQTEAAVVMLAQLLRYMIYQAQQDRVPLRQEVEHLRHYIELQKMRLTNRHPVTFTVEGDIDAYTIEPLLFIPFVENAFKYGPAAAEGSINIRLSAAEDVLTFEALNPIPSSPVPPNPDVSGIGIANSRKRLALHYPNRHRLDIERADRQFRVHLTLHLDHEQTALHRH